MSYSTVKEEIKEKMIAGSVQVTTVMDKLRVIKKRTFEAFTNTYAVQSFMQASQLIRDCSPRHIDTYLRSKTATIAGQRSSLINKCVWSVKRIINNNSRGDSGPIHGALSYYSTPAPASLERQDISAFIKTTLDWDCSPTKSQFLELIKHLRVGGVNLYPVYNNYFPIAATIKEWVPRTTDDLLSESIRRVNTLFHMQLIPKINSTNTTAEALAATTTTSSTIASQSNEPLQPTKPRAISKLLRRPAPLPTTEIHTPLPHSETNTSTTQREWTVVRARKKTKDLRIGGHGEYGKTHGNGRIKNNNYHGAAAIAAKHNHNNNRGGSGNLRHGKVQFTHDTYATPIHPSPPAITPTTTPTTTELINAATTPNYYDEEHQQERRKAAETVGISTNVYTAKVIRVVDAIDTTEGCVAMAINKFLENTKYS
ncbi:MAG: hypothetical protein NWF07_09470, partial [Candidatus Bathyarchaeota archaeon]|nr:hypothetical protein [Candidatus Bathyarchaeota archaeon]